MSGQVRLESPVPLSGTGKNKGGGAKSGGGGGGGGGHQHWRVRLAPMDILCVPSYRQDSTYHDPCYTSCGVLGGARKKLLKEAMCTIKKNN